MKITRIKFFFEKSGWNNCRQTENKSKDWNTND